MEKLYRLGQQTFLPLHRQLTLFYQQVMNLHSAKKKQKPHLFNVEWCKLHDRWTLKLFREMLLNGDIGGFVFFLGDCQERGLNLSLRGCDLHRNYGMVVILLSFLCNYDNLTLKLHQKNAATLMKDGFLLADSKLEVYQERVLPL